MNEATIKEATRCVYDRYEWVTHDFEQVNHLTGEVLHSAKGVEFPASWSANAETIVVTKYFRGDETSLKHLVDRIVVKYTTEGFKHGYFDSEKRALEFAARFRSRSFNNTMLIHVQHYAAFQQGRVPEPMPTYVAGFRQWLSLNRAVMKGQCGYAILAPVTARFATTTPTEIAVIVG